MARPGVSKNDVFAAATELLGRGSEPTIEQVRGVLGTGSNSTIAGFLREWRALHTKGEAQSLNGDLPHEFVGLMKGLWQRLLHQSNNMIATIQQNNEQTIAELNAELDALKRENAKQQQQFVLLKQANDLLTGDKLALEQVLIKKDQEIASWSAQHEGLSTQITEKERHLAELSRLHKQAQENLEHFRAASREQRLLDQERHGQQLQQAEETIKQLRQELGVMTQEKITIVHQANKVLHEKDSLFKSNETMVQKLEKLKSEINQSQKEQGESERKAQHWHAESERLQKKTDEQNLMLIDLQKQTAVLSQQLNVSNETANELKDQNKLLAHEKWLSEQEKSQLFGQVKQLQEIVQVSHRD